MHKVKKVKEGLFQFLDKKTNELTNEYVYTNEWKDEECLCGNLLNSEEWEYIGHCATLEYVECLKCHKIYYAIKRIGLENLEIID